MWGVFLSFDGTYIKSFILLRRMECKQSVFFEKNSILYQRTYFSESIENFDGWYIYFKIMGFAAV